MHFKTESNDLLEKLNCCVTRQNTRVNTIFHCKITQVNIFLKSLLYLICNLLNSISGSCDLAIGTLNNIIEVVRHNLKNEIYSIH